MGETTTKIKIYLFLSIICLLFNLSVCATAYAINSHTILNTGADDIEGNMSGYNSTVDVVTSTFVGVGTSFLPFFSLINIATLDLYNIPFLLGFYILVAMILSVLQSFLIALIILNMLPFFNA